MSDHQIAYRPLELEEIDGVPAWISRQAGWTTNDSTFLKLCHALDPDGFIAAVHPIQGIVGIVLSVNMDDRYSSAGLYLVSREYRSLGIGKRLWDAMLDHVTPRCLGINSVENRVQANLKKGMTQPLFKASILNGKMRRGVFYPNHPTLHAQGDSMNAAVERDSSTAITEELDVKMGHYLTTDLNNNVRIRCENWDPISKKAKDPIARDDREVYKLEALMEQPNRDVLYRLADLKFWVKDRVDNASYAFRLVEGNQVPLERLVEYDTQIHGGIGREEFLKTYLGMSKATDCTKIDRDDAAASQTLVKCYVAIGVDDDYLNPDDAITLRGYAIIRPRVCHDKKSDRDRDAKLWANDFYHYFIVGPLYADDPYVAKVLLNCLIKSLPPTWRLDLEMTVPTKSDTVSDKSMGQSDQIRADFLNAAARDLMGLNCEVDCYRMYQNLGQKSLKIPPIPLGKVYSLVSSDVYLV